MGVPSILYEAAALKASDATAGNNFGAGVAVDGRYAAVGATNKSPSGLSGAGGVYMLELNTGTGEWEEKSFLIPSATYGNSAFGYSVSVSGTYVVVGAYGVDPGGLQDAGAAYVFERNSSTGAWEEKTRMVASDGVPIDNFRSAVSVSGTYAVVGAGFRIQLGANQFGGAYVFERNPTTGAWEQQAVLSPSDLPIGTASEHNVSTGSVSGTYLIVGAYAKAGGGGAYMYERNSGTGVWEQKAILVASDAGASFSFGSGVSISGSYAVIGSSNKTAGALTLAGGAYVFERISGTWTQTAILNNPDPSASDRFGNSVSISGVNAVIGCNGKAPGSKSAAGSA
ncbi:hypothetical protein JKP88DRAFT_201179, partial [Tribonema minus]